LKGKLYLFDTPAKEVSILNLTIVGPYKGEDE